jgi:glycosyltransferase involved in cell wall biosynthesis
MDEFKRRVRRRIRSRGAYDVIHANFFMSGLVAADVNYAADPSRIEIVPCGFDPTEFGPMDRRRARLELGLGPEEKVVLQLGRMVPRKGVDNVVRAVARLRRDHGLSARLLIVGGESATPDPALTPEIGRLAAIAPRRGSMTR